MFKFNRLLLALGTGMAAFSSHTSYAFSDETVVDIEVIEVYAQKRLQKISDVSVAVTVMDGETIDRWQLKDTTQLGMIAPNVKVTNNAGEGTPPAFNIRGVGMIDYNTSTVSPIAIYSDGIVSGSANNLSVNLYDLDHAEILRGPQGTLFGRNTTGGAILLRSKRPEDTFGGYVNVSLAEHDHSSIDGAVNMPVTEDTALRFAFNQEDYSFSTNNQMDGQPDGGLKQSNFRLSLASTFDDFTLFAKVHYEDWSGKPKPIASLGVNKVDGSGKCTPSQAGSKLCQDNFLGQVGGNDYWDVRADTADREHDSESWGASIELTWQLNPSTTLTSLTGYRTLDRYHSWDSDGVNNLIEGDMGTDTNLITQELNIAVEGINSYWVSGVFYLNEEIEQNNSFDLFRDFRAVSPLAAEFLYDNKLENSVLALYSQVDLTLDNDFIVTAGLRYTDETTDYRAAADLDSEAIYIPKLWDLTGKVEDSELSGKLALIKKLNEYSSLYASYSRGYKSGGYNAGYSTSPAQAADSTYSPETLNAWEVGSKLQFWQNNAQLNLAAFYYDYQDQQVFVNVQDSAVPYHVLKNAGDSTIYGIESELTVTPSNELSFNLNIGYLPTAHIGSYQQSGITVEDNRLPFSSKWNISGYVLYETIVAGKSLISQLGFDYQSDFYFDQNENIYTQQDDFILLNGRISLEVSDDLLFSLWGKNLTNTEYAELRFDSIEALGAVTELKGEARQIGIELSYHF
jgi:iron complex outermembrane receptor protein